MRGIFVAVVVMFLLCGCGSTPSAPSGQHKPREEVSRPTAMSSAAPDTFLLYARDIIKRAAPLRIDSPITKSPTTYPRWNPETDTFHIPQELSVSAVFWFRGGVPEPPEPLRLFLLNYLCLVETAVQMRKLKKVYTSDDVAREELAAQWFALSFLNDLSRYEPAVSGEVEAAMRFLRNTALRVESAWSDLEKLKKRLGKERGRLGALRLMLAAHMLPLWKKAPSVETWIKENIIEPAKKAKRLVKWWRPQNEVWSLKEGTSARGRGIVIGIVATKSGYVVLGDTGGLLSLGRNRRRVTEVRRGLLALRGICAVGDKILGVERRFLRIIEPRSLNVGNIKIWPHFRNISGAENFGIVPIAADAQRIVVADNMQNALLIFNHSGNLLKRIDCNARIGGITLLKGAIYATFPTLHTVERYDEQIGCFVTVAGVRGKFGHRDGRRFGALFNHPVGIAAGPDEALYVADTLNRAVRRVTPEGEVRTVAGYECGERDGKASEAAFVMPIVVTVDAAGRVLVADRATGRVAVVGHRFEPKVWPMREEKGPGEIGAVLREAPLGEKVYAALIKRARWHLAAGHKEDALRDLKTAQKLAPEWAETYLEEAKIYKADGNLTAALAALSTAVSQKRELPLSERSGDTAYLHLLFLQAQLLRATGKKDEALTTLSHFFRLRRHRIKALSLPDLPEDEILQSYRLKAQTLAELGRKKEAVEAFRELIKAQGPDAKTLMMFGNLLEQVGRYKDAVEAYERAVLLDETATEPHFLLGKLYEDHLNDLVKAFHCYKAYLRLKGKRKDEAKQHLRELTRLLRDRPPTGYSEARVKDAEGRLWIVRRFSDGRVVRIPVEER